MPCWLVGAGPMAQAYGHVLKADGTPCRVIGRGEDSARRFEEAVGLPVIRNGLLPALERDGAPEQAIVALPIPDLADAIDALVKAGTSRILVEKPAALNSVELDQLSHSTAGTGADIRVAYNRRFMESTRAVRRGIEEDGGVTFLRFEFTERQGLTADPRVLANWFLANSTHVVDMAFHLAGKPMFLSAAADRPNGPFSATRFAGQGRTETGAFFSYGADWMAPGRWGVEITTVKRRFILQPLEKVLVQALGSFSIEEMTLDDSLDTTFKPGIARQLRAFLTGDEAWHLKTLDQQAEDARSFYRDILQGTA